MLGKRKRAVAMVPPLKKRRNTSAIEEISFDFDARADYLTGFHKRKLQRIKHAQEQAAKQDREDKLAARKAMRDERKADLEKHVKAVNDLLRKAELGVVSSDSEGDEDGWGGIEDVPPIDHEAEYNEDDWNATVTVEEVDVTRDGLQKVSVRNDDDDEANAAVADEADAKVKAAAESAEKGKKVWTKERPAHPRKKKKKFRYESKTERKLTRVKEGIKRKARVQARKGE